MENINRGMKILIVDDSRTMRRIVKKFLNQNDFNNLVEAPDGLKALEVIQNEGVDMIICDLNMPKMNGMELLKIVKQDERTRGIPFIMLTVEAIQKTMNKAVRLNVDSYIVKPVGEKVFMEQIYRVIKGGQDLHANERLKL